MAAQRVACSLLVKGCENALFDYYSSLADPKNAEQARVAQRAVDILKDVLTSWRQTLGLLRHFEVNQQWSFGDQVQAGLDLLVDSEFPSRARFVFETED